MSQCEVWKKKYPDAQAWGFGDSPQMADELAALVVKGVKTASCGSLTSYEADPLIPRIGSYHIILNGQGDAVCVIRIIALRLWRFSQVTQELAYKEGEGDRSLNYWRREHEAFFRREGGFSETMELVAEEFELVEIL